jgi:hypothetical protein
MSTAEHRLVAFIKVVYQESKFMNKVYNLYKIHNTCTILGHSSGTANVLTDARVVGKKKTQARHPKDKTQSIKCVAV